MKLSIVIAYHNEGKEFIQETIKSIKDTCDIQHEIIVVDDGSDQPLDLDECNIMRHCKNKGVGAAFDSGVKMARSNNIFLMGADIRFTNNHWASKMVTEIEKNPDALICTSVVSLQTGFPEITFEVARKHLRYDLFRGANILFKIGGDDSPHHIIEAQWLPREFLPLRSPDYVAPTESYEVPCILGAAYGVSKKWYKHIDGFWGHKFWGTLEPLISIKSWMFGGRCLVAPHIETAHIFNDVGRHSNIYDYGLYKSYNRMLVCWLLLPVPLKNELIKWLPDLEYVNEAKKMIDDNMAEIIKKRNDYIEKRKMKFNVMTGKFAEINNKILKYVY